MTVRFSEDYRPIYFLSALGAGGLTVSFYMYLMFLVKHPGTPVPTFDDLAVVYRDGSTTAVTLVSIALLGVAYFAVQHARLLASNIVAYRRFTKTSQYQSLRQSNAEVTLMAIPLTLAMTVNVVFIAFSLSVPGLWDVVEYIFPAALLAVTAIGVHSFVIFGRYLGRILTHRGFDIEDTNHFSQVLPSFAFSMIAVGFSSSAAMSTVKVTSVLGMLGAFFFLTATFVWVIVKLPVSFGAMLRQGMALEAGPTLWMGIPIFTLTGIAFVRISAGISHNLLHVELSPVLLFIGLGILVSGQVIMGLFGWTVMRRQGYFANILFGERRSAPSYGLVCPGVALSVLSMFFIHWGLVKTHVVTSFSPAHIGLLALSATVQLATIATFTQLNRKHLLGRRSEPAVSLA